MPSPKKRKQAVEKKAISSRYLLYIDVLNFAEFAATDLPKVERIYRILDSLNAHRHPNFKAIAFSDTILIYNPEPVTNRFDAEYIVWYLCEFAEDLHHRFTEQDLFFRAVLVAGEFTHYQLKNVECFLEQGKPDVLPSVAGVAVRHAVEAAGRGGWRKRMPLCNGVDRSCDITPLCKQADFQQVVVDEKTYRIFEGGNRK